MLVTKTLVQRQGDFKLPKLKVGKHSPGRQLGR